MLFTEKIYPYYKIIRPLNSLLAGVALVVGILITLGLEIIVDEFSIILVGSIIMICVSAGGFVINDISICTVLNAVNYGK